MRQQLLLFIILLVLFLPGLGRKDFYSRGEPREALVAQSMLRSGNFVLGTGYSETIPSKPPLLHWIISTFSWPLGRVTEFSARLPSALASIILVFIFYRFLLSRVDASHAFTAAIVLATSAEWFRSSGTARVDLLLSALLAGALLTFFAWVEKPSSKQLILLTGLLALATLTKGPVALILPGASMFMFLVLSKVRWFRAIRVPLAVCLVALLVSAIWYLAAYLLQGEVFWNKFYYENIARFTSSMHDEPHNHSIPYLFGTLVVGFMPWSLFIIFGLLNKSRWKIGACIKDIPTSLWRYSLIIIVSFLLFYSIPASKRSVYLLPIYPFISIYFSAYLHRLFQSRYYVIGVRFFALFLAVLFGIFSIALISQVEISDYYWKLPQILPRRIELLIASVTIFGAAAFCLFRFSNRASLVMLVLLLTLLNSTFLPIFANQRSAKNFSESAARLIEPNSVIYSYGNEFYAVSFYLNRQIYSAQLSTNLAASNFLLVYEDKLDEICQAAGSKNLQCEVLLTSDNWVEKPGQTLVLARLGEFDSKQQVAT